MRSLILATFERRDPRYRRIGAGRTDGASQGLDEAGAKTQIVSPKNQRVRAWKFTDWSIEWPVDVKLNDARPDDFDALLLPGGVINPDTLRIDPKAVAFVKAFFDEGKPVAAICHGPWTVIEAGAARGRRITSWPSLKTDLKNAGADWVDQQVVVDKGLVTSRSPDDIAGVQSGGHQVVCRRAWKAARSPGFGREENLDGAAALRPNGRGDTGYRARHLVYRQG